MTSQNASGNTTAHYLMWGFGHGLWFLLPVFFLGRFSFRYRQPPFYHYNVPPIQPSALEILSQRYARGETDATTFEQMRERLQTTSKPQ